MKQSSTDLPRGDAGRGGPVVLLVQEKAGLLAVLKVHQVADAVFHDLRLGRFREGLARAGGTSPCSAPGPSSSRISTSLRW